MKKQIHATACIVLALVCLGISFKLNDVPLLELFKAIAVVFLLISLKCLSETDSTKESSGIGSSKEHA